VQDVFDFRNRLIDEYSAFSRSFSKIAASDLSQKVEAEYDRGRYWPEPLIQINPNYKRSGSVQQLVKQGSLHPDCAALFQTSKVEGTPADLHLYVHQMQAIAKAQNHQSYVVTTGTGSGKSLSFFIPIIDRILKAKQADAQARTRAIVIYPMNALANSQLEELDKFLHGYPEGKEPFTVKRYTGQESSEERKAIADKPPDILLTNFMMLELILTRYEDTDRRVVDHCRGLDFLVLDELHTYRGRQSACRPSNWCASEPQPLCRPAARRRTATRLSLTLPACCSARDSQRSTSSVRPWSVSPTLRAMFKPSSHTSSRRWRKSNMCGRSTSTLSATTRSPSGSN
jgi:DEAD/DEAH box helicase